MNQLCIGRIVHFVLKEGKHIGEHRPAMVVKVWSENCCNLQVFTDGPNDGNMYSSNVYWATSVSQDETVPHAPGTWHWPEKV